MRLRNELRTATRLLFDFTSLFGTTLAESGGGFHMFD